MFNQAQLLVYMYVNETNEGSDKPQYELSFVRAFAARVHNDTNRLRFREKTNYTSKPTSSC